MSENSMLAAVARAAGGSDDLIPKAEVETAIATAKATAHADGLKAGKAEGAKAERERCAAILGSEEAKGREEQAKYFAFETDIPAENAVAALSKGATASAAKPTLGDRMGALGVQQPVAAPGATGAAPKFIDTASVYERFNGRSAS